MTKNVIENKPVVIDKMNIELMYCLYVNNKTNRMDSFKVKDIMNNTELKSSYCTYFSRIKKLQQEGYVAEGVKDGNAACYYISEKGIKYLKENVLDKDYIYEEE